MARPKIQVQPWQDGDDGSLLPRFYIHPADDLVHIELATPGDRNTAYDFIVDDANREHWVNRFPDAWAEFEGDGDALAGQTRLTQVPWMDVALLPDLAAVRILTVEQLAGLTDTTISRSAVRGLFQLREKARAHVREKEASSSVDKLRDENAEIRAQNAALLKRLEALEALQGGADTAEASAAA